MIRPPLPTLDPRYTYSIQAFEDSDDYRLCIYEKNVHNYYDDTPLAFVVLAEYPADFEMVIWQAIVILARYHPDYYTTTLPDTLYFYTQALYSTVSKDEIR